MPVQCGCRINGLWVNEEKSNAWVHMENRGWRKLDNSQDTACTNLLTASVSAKRANAAISVREVTRSNHTYITEMYDYVNGWIGPTQEVSFSVSECVYGWTAAYAQRGTGITIRIRLDPDDDVTAQEMANLRTVWKNSIESKWSGRFGCCNGSNCSCQCALQFRVEWVTSNEHHRVRVRRGPARSNMTTWDTSDSGDVASHEFGHMLGHPDEYSDSACPGRSPVNTGTVMDDNTEVVERLCEAFCDRLGQNAEPV